MTVYIEYLFINNLIINFILVKTSAIISRSKTTILSKGFSSLTGACFSIILPKINNFLLPLIKLLIAMLLPIISIKYKNIKNYIFCFTTFMFFIFFIGGALSVIKEFFNINQNSKFYLLIELIIVAIIMLFGYIYSVKINRNKKVYPYVYDCLINIGGNVYKTSGFIDTGNQSYYKETPIIFCDKNLSKIIEKDTVNHITYMSNITTIAGKTDLKIIKNANLLIYYGKDRHIHKNVVLGLTNRKLKYDLFLNPDVINGGHNAW